MKDKKATQRQLFLIEEQLYNDGYNHQLVNSIMAIINKNWESIYNDGGINPNLKPEFETLNNVFDKIDTFTTTNDIVQIVVN